VLIFTEVSGLLLIKADIILPSPNQLSVITFLPVWPQNCSFSLGQLTDQVSSRDTRLKCHVVAKIFDLVTCIKHTVRL